MIGIDEIDYKSAIFNEMQVFGTNSVILSSDSQENYCRREYAHY